MIFKQLSLTKSYIIAFLVIAMWAIFAFFTMKSLIESHKKYAKLINLSGKQRMLSQKTALHVSHYIMKYEKNQLEYLKSLVITMKYDHLYIIANLTSEKMKMLYFKKNGLSTNVPKYISSLENFLQAPSKQYSHNIVDDSEKLLKQLNEAVHAFEKESYEIVIELNQQELFILIGTILTLIFEALFIIRPAVVFMGNYTKNLEKEVKKRTKELSVFNKIFENSSEGMIITDSKKNILNVNSAFTKITGYKKVDILGKIPNILQSGKNSFSLYKNMWSEIVKNSIWEGIVIDKCKSGKEININLTILKLINEETKEINYVGVFSDITNHIELMKSLKYQKDQVQYYLDVAQVLILVLDNNYIVKMINQKGADILGYSKEEIVGKNWIETFLPKDIQSDIKKIGDDIIGKIDVHLGNENLIVTKSGEERLLLWNNSTLVDENDNSIGILTSGIDITDQRENERQLVLHAKHAQMGEMISLIAHQWRQPLSTISVIVGGLKVKIALDTYDEEYFNNQIDSIVGLTQHLSNTINDFREFFKEDKNKSSTTLEDIVEKSLSIIKPILVDRDISLKVEYLSNEEIFTYINELKQVVINILKNSEEILVEKKIEDAEINIKTYSEGDSNFLEIKDNAGGVREDIIDKIFEPYFTTKGDLNGTGLGLYMSKKIIEEHCGGKLTVTNKDGGACFTIEL